jgi:imidazolonepropionase-like amidohydrolase
MRTTSRVLCVPAHRPALLISALVIHSMLAAVGAEPLHAQRYDELATGVQSQMVEVADDAFAITHVTLIDGTGSPAQHDMTVVVRDGRIAEVMPAAQFDGAGLRTVDGAGRTLMPGMVGLHNHLYYTAAGGRGMQLNFSAPLLYLGSGVTTVRTTGSRNAYSEINLKAEIDAGREAGPRIHITAPYITGGEGSTTMTLLDSPEQARRFVSYWAAEGATWLKAYTNVGYDEMQAAVDEAHRLGLKVTGHICSISFREAVDMGFDNIEHGLFTNSDYHPDKQRSECPSDYRTYAMSIEPAGPEAQQTFRAMIDAGVPMTSTLAVYELFVQGRPTRDPRALDAMAPEVRDAYLAEKDRIDVEGWPPEWMQAAMAYEKAFVEAGGLLAAGVDPTGNGGALPGYGDQRNVELLREAGFTPEEVVQIISLNGARILGIDQELGSIEPGKIADLVLMDGDFVADPSAIRNVTLVFKDGVGYRSQTMFDMVRGRVGIG